MYRRGDIYYINRRSFDKPVGSEQLPGRPAIVVSNDENNEFSPTLEIVYLTTQPKTNLPTHVDIKSSPKPSIALCEQITTIDKERVGDYLATCSEYEMMLIEAALEISLGMGNEISEAEEEPIRSSQKSRESFTPPRIVRLG